MIAGMSRNFSEEETASNARLIAVAPEMLAVCEKLVRASQAGPLTASDLLAEAMAEAREILERLENE